MVLLDLFDFWIVITLWVHSLQDAQKLGVSEKTEFTPSRAPNHFQSNHQSDWEDRVGIMTSMQIHADPSSVFLSMWNRGKHSVGLGLSSREIAELQYQSLLVHEVVDLSKNFYFSYTKYLRYNTESTTELLNCHFSTFSTTTIQGYVRVRMELLSHSRIRSMCKYKFSVEFPLDHSHYSW